MIFARKLNQIPEFYMIYARKMLEFYMIIVRKIFPRILGALVSPAPVSYANVRDGMYTERASVCRSVPSVRHTGGSIKNG